LNASRNLGAILLRDIIEMSDRVSISPISCYEIAIAQQKGRLYLPCPLNQWLSEALEPSGISLLPLTSTVACQAVELSPIHKDPFDRLIIATALTYQAKLASIDNLFSRYQELEGVLLSQDVKN
jgi:PIN domain nuclease of toxin-antitoxin system